MSTSTYQHKDNSGSVFPNDKKESDSHPDFRGSAVIEGREYWVSAWNRTSKDGSKEYLGIELTAKEQS